MMGCRGRVRQFCGWLMGGLLCVSTPAWAEEPDWSLYGQLLQEYLSRDQAKGIDLAWLDYSGLKRDGRFEQVVEQLEAWDPTRLANDRERLAFYINAYNILTINLALVHWPVDSIKDAAPFYRSVWGMEAGRLNGRAVSLDDVEHKILRPMKEPRIHFAIVCASLSCPDLRDEPYTAASLDRQLNDQTRDFLANPTKGVSTKDNRVRISKIFDWFGEDFGGEAGVLDFIAQYRPALNLNVAPGYLPYDWSLNGN